eukprot:6490302-Amphidinium_carterae.4
MISNVASCLRTDAEAFLIGTKSGLDEEDWLNANADIWPLALPRPEMKKILETAGDGKWASLKKELYVVSILELQQFWCQTLPRLCWRLGRGRSGSCARGIHEYVCVDREAQW